MRAVTRCFGDIALKEGPGEESSPALAPAEGASVRSGADRTGLEVWTWGAVQAGFVAMAIRDKLVLALREES
jgi:hypothetical protein